MQRRRFPVGVEEKRLYEKRICCKGNEEAIRDKVIREEKGQ